MKVGILDYGAGNVCSVQYALERKGVIAVLSNKIEELNKCEKLIFPGVGHAKQAMENIKKENLISFIKETKKDMLGICLGMQLMGEFTEEGSQEGLGIFDFKVKKFTPNNDFKVPNMGWQKISQQNSSKLFKGIKEDSYFYFVHSYYVENNNYSIANCNTSSLRYSVAVQKDNYYAVQFHPEKSSSAGEIILQNFLEI